jgi:hypothetical protein
MAAQKKLGVYWGDFGIHFVEVVKDSVALRTSVPFSAILDDTSSNFQSISEDARLLELIQKTLRNLRFSSVEAHLAVPSKDVIVRWFAIPFMKSHEIQGVVTFEARKYIPFPLEELDFTYYPSTFTRDGVKQIGIVFVGIRKEVLRRYITVLAQSGLNVIYTEPACMSFLRALVYRKVVDLSKMVAILNIDRNRAEIDIASNGFVKFVRDFNLSSGQTPGIDDPENFLRAKCYNESRISLDFFNRQHSEDVSQVIALTVVPDQAIGSGLMDDLGLPVISVDAASLINTNEAVEMGVVGAFGVALSGQIPTVVDFNLSEGDAATGVHVKTQERRAVKIPSFLFALISGFVSLSMLLGTWFLSYQQFVIKERAVAEVSLRLGKFIDMQQEEIESQQSKQKKVINTLKPLAYHSTLTPVALRLFHLLPEGMWLSSLSFSYKETSPEQRKRKEANKDVQKPAPVKGASNISIRNLSINFSGYIFLDDPNMQYDAVNHFLSTLRADDELAKYGTNFKLMSLKVQAEKGKDITSFTIVSQ